MNDPQVRPLACPVCHSAEHQCPVHGCPDCERAAEKTEAFEDGKKQSRREVLRWLRDSGGEATYWAEAYEAEHDEEKSRLAPLESDALREVCDAMLLVEDECKQAYDHLNVLAREVALAGGNVYADPKTSDEGIVYLISYSALVDFGQACVGPRHEGFRKLLDEGHPVSIAMGVERQSDDARPSELGERVHCASCAWEDAAKRLGAAKKLFEEVVESAWKRFVEDRRKAVIGTRGGDSK